MKRQVTGPADRVLIVGAGLGGLACAMHLAAAGRQVTIVERESGPGGRAGLRELQGYRFDTGPAVLTMPELIEQVFAGLGERMSDWLDLQPLDPAYRAHYPDGSTLDVICDPPRMADQIHQLCGAREAAGYLRFAAHAQELWKLERRDFIARNLDQPQELLTANLLRLAASGGFRRLSGKVNGFFRDPRLRRLFSFQSLYVGMSPQEAMGMYAVIAYMDTIAGVYFPKGGMYALPTAMAAAAQRHGVKIRYQTEVTRVETRSGRATGVLTATGERIPADVVVLNPDLPVAYRELLGEQPRAVTRQRPSPSAVVLHVGSRQRYQGIAHHNIHFGKAWKSTFREIIHQGRLMSDPSLFITNPSRTDPSLAANGGQTYYVLAPAPNLEVGHQHWRDTTTSQTLASRYTDQLIETLEARGYVDFGSQVEVCATVTPQDWQRGGMEAGTPFSAAHNLLQTGPFRPSTIHPRLDNVLFVGSGTQPGVGVPMVLISGKLAAARITG